MIWKRNRLYYNSTEILKIHRWFYDISIPELNVMLDMLEDVYKRFKFYYKIKKPNINIMYIYLKYLMWNVQGKERDEKLYKLNTYINLYRNDEN